MSASQYKAFAGGAGANTLSPTAWAALTDLLAKGFQTGVARSEHVNTVLRQTSVFTAAFTAWMADNTVTDVIDSGDPAALKALIVEALGAIATPPGIVETHYAYAAPRGRLAMQGQLVSRTTYSKLWAWVVATHTSTPALVADAAWAAVPGNTSFSTGDGSTTFRLPDFRAFSARYWDNTREIDPVRVLGSYQADQYPEHSHTYSGRNSAVPGGAEGGSRDSVGIDTQTTGTSGTGTEVRVKSVALLACITTGQW